MTAGPSARFPARLHVLLASDAHVGVVFRRGPSKRVCSVLWDRDADRFTLGQWLKGRIYERRADLSPDGRHLIYFAMNGKWKSETKGSWTAVSRAPHLKALALYAKGDCWEGGGLFLSAREYWLNDRHFSAERTLAATSTVSRRPDYRPPQGFGSEDTGVYYPRLLRDGWSLVEHRGCNLDRSTIFDKPAGRHWTLRKIAHEQVGSPAGRGCYWDEHELHLDGREPLAKPGWEWADVDKGQLVWAEAGCLYRARVGRADPTQDATVLHDFNSMTFENVVAPY